MGTLRFSAGSFVVAMTAACLLVRAAAEGGESDHASPAKVGDEARLLLKKISMELVGTQLGDALAFLGSMSNLDVSVSKGAYKKVVTLKLEEATLAEALRQVKDQAGAVHRVLEGRLCVAMPEEWSTIDAGKAKFEIGEPEPERVVELGKTRQPVEVQVSKGNADRRYFVEGREYSEEKLKEERPELWKELQKQLPGSVPEAQGQVEDRIDYQGKSYSEAEFRKAFPEVWEELQRRQAGATGLEQGLAIRRFNFQGKSYSEEEFKKAFPELYQKVKKGW